MRTKCPIDMKQSALEREFHKLSLCTTSAWFCHDASQLCIFLAYFLASIKLNILFFLQTRGKDPRADNLLHSL